MALSTGSDFSGVGAFCQSLDRLNVSHNRVFACDMDKYARQAYCLNFGTENDVALSKSFVHTKMCDDLLKMALKELPTDKLDLAEHLKDHMRLRCKSELLAKEYSFHYSFDVYARGIPEESLGIYMTSPPCQSFSLAGKREGENSNKGVLFYNSHEFIRINKPRYFIFENVKGLLSDDGGKTFQRWIDYLGGKSVNGNPVLFPLHSSVPYHVYYQVLNAKHYGVPQNRERIFIVGIRDDADNEFSFPKPFHLVKRLRDVLEPEVDEKYFLSEKMIKCLLNDNEKHKSKGNGFKFECKNNDDIANSVTTKAGQRGTDNFIQDEIIQLNDPAHSNDRIYSDKGISPTLNTMQGGNRQPFVELSEVMPVQLGKSKQFQETSNLIGEVDQEAFCIRATQSNGVMIQSNTLKGYDIAEEEEDSINFSNPNSETRRGRVGKGVAQTLETQCNQGVLVKKRIRKLTPTECFRLMDFNPEMIEKTISSGLISDSQLYKQAGNSICIEPLKLIIQKLLKI